MSQFTDKDAAKETNSTGSQTAAAWHQARDDSGAREGKDTIDKAPSWAKDDLKCGVSLFPKGKK